MRHHTLLPHNSSSTCITWYWWLAGQQGRFVEADNEGNDNRGRRQQRLFGCDQQREFGQFFTIVSAENEYSINRTMYTMIVVNVLLFHTRGQHSALSTDHHHQLTTMPTAGSNEGSSALSSFMSRKQVLGMVAACAVVILMLLLWPSSSSSSNVHHNTCACPALLPIITLTWVASRCGLCALCLDLCFGCRQVTSVLHTGTTTLESRVTRAAHAAVACAAMASASPQHAQTPC